MSDSDYSGLDLARQDDAEGDSRRRESPVDMGTVLADASPPRHARAAPHYNRFPRRTLTGTQLAVMWGLRVYAVLMVVVLIVQAVRLAHLSA